MRWLRPLLLLLTAAAILLREPRLLAVPRLWGEEGSIYYQFAFHNSFLDALLFLPVRAEGYYSLTKNLIPALAVQLVPVESAPVFTTWVSLLLQLAPAVVIVWGSSYAWNRWWQRALACALLVFSPVAGIELWLNSNNLMSLLGVAALCVLLEDYRADVSRVRAWLHRAILVVAGLAGPYAVVLTPLFLWKAWRERTRESRVQAVVLLAACVVQGAVLVATVRSGGLDRARAGHAASAAIASAALVTQLVHPLFGGLATGLLKAFDLRAGIRPDASPAEGLRTLLALLPALAALAVLLWPAPPRWPRLLLLAAALISASVVSLAALGGVPAGRYAYLSGIAFGLLLVHNLAPGADAPAGAGGRWRRGASAVVLAVTLCAGLAQWHDFRQAADWDPQYPDWSAEVARWRADPRRPIAGVPDSFDVVLQRRGIAGDFKQQLQEWEGLTLGGPNGPREARLAVRGLPDFGRILLVVETELPPRDLHLSVEFTAAGGRVLAAGRLAPMPARSPAGRLALIDTLLWASGRDDVTGVRLLLSADTADSSGAPGAITIRRARFGDELLFL